VLSLLHRGVLFTPQLTHCLLGEEMEEVLEEDMVEETGDNDGGGMVCPQVL
jgi:hypothetical protein